MRIMMWAVCIALGIVIAVFMVISYFMVAAAVNKPPADGTVVVLGARIRGDRPSRMLCNRLDAAWTYLTMHPTANCIVSGGLGQGEQYTEAYVMKKHLIERGIAPSRIIEEDRSTNTYENIIFSLTLIRQQCWDERLVIATQEFHQYRAATLACRAGVTEVFAAACLSPLHTLPFYWLRECAAIVRLWICGH